MSRTTALAAALLVASLTACYCRQQHADFVRMQERMQQPTDLSQSIPTTARADEVLAAGVLAFQTIHLTVDTSGSLDSAGAGTLLVGSRDSEMTPDPRERRRIHRATVSISLFEQTCSLRLEQRELVQRDAGDGRFEWHDVTLEIRDGVVGSRVTAEDKDLFNAVLRVLDSQLPKPDPNAPPPR